MVQREHNWSEYKDLGLGDPIQQLSTTDRSSQYHDTAFFNQLYSPSLLGKYWCQVINTTADPDQPLMRSNVFTLLAPENYNGSACTLIQTVDNRTCANVSVNQQLPVQSGSSAITTTQQTSSYFQLPVHATTPFLTSTNKISASTTTTMKLSENTLISTSHKTTGQK